MEFQAFPVDDDAPTIDDVPKTLDIGVLDAAVAVSPVKDAWIAATYEPCTRQMPPTRLKHADSAAEGAACEAAFQSCVPATWQRIVTTAADDYFNRIDAAFQSPDNGTLLFDVKAMRRVSRADSSPQNRFLWLELHRGGSLFGGASPLLAVQVGDGAFLILSKPALQAWVQEVFSSSQRRVACSSQALRRPYRRPGRFAEWISMVDMEDAARVAGVAMLKR